MLQVARRSPLRPRGRLLAVAAVAALAGAFGAQAPAPAETVAPFKGQDPQRYPSVNGITAPAAKPAPPSAEAVSVARPAPAWPAPATADVTVPASTARSATKARAGSLPILIGPAAASQDRVAKVRVEVLSQAQARAAGVTGVLVRIGRADGGTAPGPVSVAVDYSSFRHAYGADWASRLRLVRLSGCVPATSDCAAVPLASRNDVRGARVSADVPAAPAGASGTLVALTGGPSSGAGDFTASSLAPSSTWGHGGSTGGFTWSYPMRVPPAASGPAPDVSLSYASQSVDGRHAATNNQPGAIGEGFAFEPGFIERRYKACADDMDGDANNSEKTGDLCWGTENATLSLGGSSVELLKGSDGKWHPRREDGSKIELLTTPAYSNGDNNNEYWKVTTANGTQYWFGRHQLPGWSSDRPTTNSVLTVPVFGNNPNEPCHASTFAASHCNQAWRWNLDYVQDVHGNTMSLWWARESNRYARNLTVASPVEYHRGGYLTRIDYGTDNRDNNEYASAPPYVENAPGRVEFTPADRCLSNCTSDESWPDTPSDQECTATTNPCLNGSPTFWSRKRLSVVTTKVWKAATSSYQAVDSWTLRQTFPDPGDGTRAGLWLDGITHRGLNGTAIALPEVTFEGMQMNNRVDAAGSDWALAMNWRRVNSIRTENGAEIFVTYSGRQCVAGSNVPTALDSNRMRCYPVRWTPPAYTAPITDYFHKYVVTEVQQIDHTGGAETLLTRYEYENPDNLPLWHHDDDDGLAPANRKTWGQWRGYPTVVTRVGEGTDETKTETLYFRGMHGDKLAAGGTRSVTVQGLEGGAATDYDHFAGMPRERITWLGSTVLSATVTDPWRSDATATRAGTPAAEARYARTRTVRTRTALDGGAWRRTTATTTYDDYGMPTTVDDLGDAATTGDDRCTATEYARNTSGTDWLLTPVKRVHGWADDCATAPTAANQVTADTRFTLDALAFGAAPSKGAVTKVETIKDWNGGSRLYQTVSTSKYDLQGRVTEVTDIAGEITTTAYVPAAGGPLTQTTTMNPLSWNDKVDFDPAWGLPTKRTDPNSRETEVTYDALGRTAGVWLPGRARTSFPNDPSTGFTYTVSMTVPSAITTRTLNPRGGYHTTFELVDALGRPRQTQTFAYGGGRIITDAFYDSAGRVWKSNAAYYNSGAAGTSLYSGLDLDMPSQTRTLYDGAGRPTNQILFSENVEQWRTTTAYHGDHTSMTPPEGGTATTVWTDARGNTTKLWQHHGATPTGTYDETRYAYHPAGQLATVIDASGNTWSYEYDIQGRQIQATDPDAGTATATYNAFGDLETATDARGATLAYTYDDLGRPTTVREGSTAGAKRAEWVYDTPVKGMTRSASRWIGANEYKTETVSVDIQYRPTQTRTIIPAVEGNLAGTYTFRASYRADGSPNTMILPAAGGLSAETLTYDYDSTYAMPDMLLTNYPGATHYVIDATFTNLYEPNTTTRSTALTGSPLLQTTQHYYEDSGRVKNRSILKSTGTAYISNTEYKYEDVGDVSKIDDLAGTRDTQCFEYDHQRRLTQAWTPASADCDAAPATSGLGGPAPYWHEWSFGDPTDPAGRIGNRLSQTEHATTGDVTTTYSYPAAGAERPHALSGFARTGPTGTTTGAYTYDLAGNTLTRPGANGQQTLTWDLEGHLATLTDTAGTNSYIYDAAGNRLISKDATGATLHLGDTELRLTTATGQVGATRYYTFNGEMVAQRTVSGVSWLAADHQGTNRVAVTADAAQTVTWRRQTPYGTPRGTTPAWPNKLGFVGGYQDPTGLTHLGAREYDPTTGRFISVDPVIDPGNPQQLHGYAYAGNTPITNSDPSGLIPPEYLTEERPKECPQDVWGYQCMDLVENKGGKSKSQSTGNETLHNGLDGCGLAPVVGVACDVINGVVYIQEKDYTNTAVIAVSMIPGVDLVCKIKAFCKSVADAVGEKVGRLLGKGHKVPHGGAGPATTAADDMAEIAQQKAADRAAGGAAKQTAPKPTGPPPPTKKGGGGPGPTPAKTNCKHSFNPATPVLMADGSTEAIGEIDEGDEVLAHDPESGTTSAQMVSALHVNQDTDLTDLTIRTDDGQNTTLNTTQHHPFWSETRQNWVDAAELQPGEHLRTTVGEASVTVVRNLTGAQTMRDLTVAEVHTYYVLAGTTPVLVHNCGEEEVRDAIQNAYPERNVRTGGDVRRPDGTQWTDHDVYDDDFVCEVACGGGKGKVAQMEERILPSAGGRRVAIYGPNLKGSVAKGIENLGVPVFRNLNDLVAWVGPKS